MISNVYVSGHPYHHYSMILLILSNYTAPQNKRTTKFEWKRCTHQWNLHSVPFWSRLIVFVREWYTIAISLSHLNVIGGWHRFPWNTSSRIAETRVTECWSSVHQWNNIWLVQQTFVQRYDRSENRSCR